MKLVDNKGSNDPYVNLAIEEYLVRNQDCSNHDFLFLSVNRPCIVLGKNQSIYREINFEYLRNPHCDIARRITGGGTVYHDAGNLNLAFITKFAESKINVYSLFNVPLIKALKKKGITAELDKRSNLLCNGKKISGSAQFTNRQNILGHGTLLVNADLEALRASLKANDFIIETKAVQSIKSPVMNLSEINAGLKSAEDVRQIFLEEFPSYGVHQFTEQEWSLIHQSAEEKFRSFDWIYGRSPQTRIIKNGYEILTENGIINAIKSPRFRNVETNRLTGIRYEINSIKKALEDNPSALIIASLIF